MNPNEPVRPLDTGAVFATTRWTLVLGAGGIDEPGRHEILTGLCRTYWPPVYAYIRRQGVKACDAQDLAQAFFSRLLQRDFFARAERERGRFRTFLLCSLQNFLRDEHDRMGAAKRGGTNVFSFEELKAEQGYLSEPVDGLTPERLFERRWALTLLERVMARLETEFRQSARGELFVELRQRLWGGNREEPVHELARRLGVGESAFHVMLHRLRARLRELLRAEIAELVESPADVEDEIAHMIRVLGNPV